MSISKNNNQILGWWLLCCAAFVYLMVVVGGVTRLTQSGLSMVEWRPLMGVLPPLSQVEWMAVFEKYQAFPEYQQINAGMSLAEFKQIFWWEYGHRVLGRLIGLIYFLPLLYFWIRGMVPKHWRIRLVGLFVLGGLQGVMGWYMVMSGLVDLPHVSQYRLTAHLGLAIVIFGFMLWYAMDFLRADEINLHSPKRLINWSTTQVCLVFVMILSGGFVAGTKAGFIFNTFPTMHGDWVPQSVMAMQPVWKNLFENPVTIQFVHRVMALIVTVVTLILCLKLRGQKWAPLLLFALAVQLGLGISALLLRVPVELGAAHQGGAVALLAASLLVAHSLRKSPQT